MSLTDDLESVYVALQGGGVGEALAVLPDITASVRTLLDLAATADGFVRDGKVSMKLSIRDAEAKKRWNALVMDVLRARHMLE